MIGDMVGIRINVSTYAYADHVLNGHHSDTGVSVNRRRRLALDILRLLLFIFMLLLAPLERRGLKKSDEKYVCGGCNICHIVTQREFWLEWFVVASRGLKLNVQVALRATITKQLSPALPFSTCNFDFFTYFTLNSSHITKRVITGSLGNSFVLPRIRRLSVQSLLSIPKQTLLDVSRAPKDLFFSLKKKFEIHHTACWFLTNSRQTPFSLAGPLTNLHSQQVGSIHWTLELI